MESCDVIVIGGGPAGSTAAALLAKRGLDVVMLEKATHPRFHIGESLLPRNLELLRRLGVAEDVARIGVRKPGAEFVADATGESQAFNFAAGLDRIYTYSYQVERAAFDALLFDNACRHGARGAQASRVIDVTPDRPSGTSVVRTVEADGAERRIVARFVLDASGRDGVMARRHHLRMADKRNNTAAVFAHFRGARFRDGDMAGCISVHLAEDGWFWMIPLPDGIMSVGFVGTQRAFQAVADSGGPEQFLQERIRRSATVNARMTQAKLASEVWSTANYSYGASRMWGDGYMMIGDAFAFLDPVFSSGVMLAMTMGEMGANVAATWLADPRAGRALARGAERQVRRRMRKLRWLIYRINHPVLRTMFMNPSNRLRMRDGLVSVLAGNFEDSRRTVLPFLAFRLAFRLLCCLHWCGLRRVGAVELRSAAH
jgi:flavin-dependent dehydrogenase